MRLVDRLASALAPQRHANVSTWSDYFAYNGSTYGLGARPVEIIGNGAEQPAINADFLGFAGAMRSCAPVWALEQIRTQVFSGIRFQWQAFSEGRPGRMFGTPELEPLNEPPGSQTLQDVLATMLLSADLAGSSYTIREEMGRLVNLRPDWIDTAFVMVHNLAGDVVGAMPFAYRYFPGGDRGARATVLAADDVAVFSPMPDPVAPWRGQSWLTPVIREIRGDGAASDHKLNYFTNGAVPGLAVSLKESVSAEEFAEFRKLMDAATVGVGNAYKTMYLGGGADVTVIGSDLRQIDFRATQGHGETRLSMAAGVPAVVLGSSEGMQGSSLNAGNYGQARRRFADGTMHPLWMRAAGTLQALFPAPRNSRLWYDARDVPFLREDAKDQAEIFGAQASALRTLVDGGFDPESVVDAVDALDVRRLVHSGRLSVQLQTPGEGSSDD